MDYTYFLEDIGNKHFDQNELDTNLLYILCYHIETQCKYPFLQFMMEKIPFCNNLIKEQFVLPHINININSNNNGKGIKILALEKVKQCLHSIGYNSTNVTDDMYRGIIWTNNLIIPYICVNISNINISGLFLSRNSSYWFVLPSEIINTKEICNIEIDNDVTNLFIQNPELSILTNPKTNSKYILPDAVYTGGEYKSVEFKSIFGNRKTKIYKNCGEYYYFYRAFLDAVKDTEKDTVKDCEFRHGINRYALFLEGELYIEIEKEFSLTDEQIEKMYPESSLIICYSNIHNPIPDILVKEYNTFLSISYHMIDNANIYTNETNKKYTII